MQEVIVTVKFYLVQNKNVRHSFYFSKNKNFSFFFTELFYYEFVKI